MMPVSRTRLLADELVRDFVPGLPSGERQALERKLAQRLAAWSTRAQVEYGRLATEADIAATELIQIVTTCRVELHEDPQPHVAEYLRNVLAEIAERQHPEAA
jgi:hypothetical protein